MDVRVPASGSLILPYQGTWPKLGTKVFIAETARVIGDVVIGDEANVWYSCVIRGDETYVRVGARTNVQDGAVVHGTEPDWPAVIGANVTIGHGAIVHGCTVEDGCLIGIGAIVLDDAVVESGALVAAGALVPPGKRVGAGEMWAGCPAKFLRHVNDAERAMIRETPNEYCARAAKYLALDASTD